MTEIDREVVLAAIAECVTVVQPGEVLAVRLASDTDPGDLDYMADQVREVGGNLGISILFMPGDEFARLIPEGKT